MLSLNGKNAFITGSSRGIGRGIAVKLAQRGAKIAVNYYKNESAANETLSMVREQGSDGFVVQGDVTREDDLKRLILPHFLRKAEIINIFTSYLLVYLFSGFLI